MIAIIDYGAGNLRSVCNAFASIGCKAEITRSAQDMARASHIVLPGVGSFGWAMDSINKLDLRRPIQDAAMSGKPFLGICLGLQLLFEGSQESPGAQGLGIFKGEIVRFEDRGLKIPHMGWNSLHFTKPAALFDGVDEGAYVYFVHSYFAQPQQASIISATIDYGETAPIAVEQGSVFATQFHPEKSGGVGMRMLRNFVKAREES